MSAKQQTELLANYIMGEIPGEPSQDQGAGNTAIRLLKQYQQGLKAVIDELDALGGDRPEPVARAYREATTALAVQDQ